MPSTKPIRLVEFLCF